MRSSKLATLPVLHVLLAVTSIGLLPTRAAAVVVPGASESVEGGSNNCAPLSGCNNFDRYQQVFASSEFAGPIWIAEIRFRRDAGETGPFSTSFSDVVIGLSTTSAGPDALSTTFANNQGSDFTIVATGALTLASASSGGSPAPFDVSVVLDTPFPYDPNEGNLLLDWTNNGGETSVPDHYYDAENVVGDPVSRVLALAGAATGTANTFGLIVEFVALAGDHACCDPGGRGCLDPTIQLTVCATDSYCCETSWDANCVGEVTSLAGQSCNACVEHATPSTSHPNRNCVCAVDPYCCETQWDNLCVEEMESLGCGSCASQGFVYVNNNTTPNSVSGFAVEPQSGAIIPAGFLVPTFSSPYSTGDASGFDANVGSIAAAIGRDCVFATNAVAGTVTAFERRAGGLLSVVESEPAGTEPIPVTVDDSRALVFVGNFGSDDISVYGFDSSCALTPVATYPVAPADTPLDLEVSPDGSKLFVSNDVSNQVSVLDIGPGGTTLTHVAGSPFAAGFGVHGLALSPDGSNLYSCDYSDNTISGFDVGVSGALASVPGSPFAAGGAPVDALVSSTGDYLIVSNNDLDALGVFDVAPDGSLSSVGSFSTDSPGQGPAGLATNDSGQQIFVVNGGFDPAPAGTATVSVYDLDGAGSLAPIPGSPFDTGVDSTPSGIAYVPEPGGSPMLAAGLATLMGLARRRRTSG